MFVGSEDVILLNQIDSYEEYLSFYKKSSNENQEIAIKKEILKYLIVFCNFTYN